MMINMETGYKNSFNHQFHQPKSSTKLHTNSNYSGIDFNTILLNNTNLATTATDEDGDDDDIDDDDDNNNNNSHNNNNKQTDPNRLNSSNDLKFMDESSSSSSSSICGLIDGNQAMSDSVNNLSINYTTTTNKSTSSLSSSIRTADSNEVIISNGLSDRLAKFNSQPPLTTKMNSSSRFGSFFIPSKTNKPIMSNSIDVNNNNTRLMSTDPDKEDIQSALSVNDKVRLFSQLSAAAATTTTAPITKVNPSVPVVIPGRDDRPRFRSSQGKFCRPTHSENGYLNYPENFDDNDDDDDDDDVRKVGSTCAGGGGGGGVTVPVSIRDRIVDDDDANFHLTTSFVKNNSPITTNHPFQHTNQSDNSNKSSSNNNINTTISSIDRQSNINDLADAESDTDSIGESVVYHQPPKAADRSAAYRLAKRLYHLNGFRITDVAKHLCKRNDFSQMVGEEFACFFDFTDQRLDSALRTFLNSFALTSETQERERILLHFSRRFYACNPGVYLSEECCHTLVCALMLLNTDLHSQNVQKKLTCDEFIHSMTQRYNGDAYSKEDLKTLYSAVKQDPIRWPHCSDVNNMMGFVNLYYPGAPAGANCVNSASGGFLTPTGYYVNHPQSPSIQQQQQQHHPQQQQQQQQSLPPPHHPTSMMMMMMTMMNPNQQSNDYLAYLNSNQLASTPLPPSSLSTINTTINNVSSITNPAMMLMNQSGQQQQQQQQYWPTNMMINYDQLNTTMMMMNNYIMTNLNNNGTVTAVGGGGGCGNNLPNHTNGVDQQFNNNRRTNNDSNTTTTTTTTTTDLSVLDLSAEANAKEYMRGLLARKCVMECSGKKTSLGRRGWKLYYARLRDLILYLYKNAAVANAATRAEELHNLQQQYQQQNYLHQLVMQQQQQLMLIQQQQQAHIDAQSNTATTTATTTTTITTTSAEQSFTDTDATNALQLSSENAAPIDDRQRLGNASNNDTAVVVTDDGDDMVDVDVDAAVNNSHTMITAKDVRPDDSDEIRLDIGVSDSEQSHVRSVNSQSNIPEDESKQNNQVIVDYSKKASASLITQSLTTSSSTTTTTVTTASTTTTTTTTATPVRKESILHRVLSNRSASKSTAASNVSQKQKSSDLASSTTTTSTTLGSSTPVPAQHCAQLNNLAFVPPETIIRVAHAYASRAVDYVKKANVFRLRTKEGAEYIFEVSDIKEVDMWIDRINFVAALLSAPQLSSTAPSPTTKSSSVNSYRSQLPSYCTKLNMREQLEEHQRRLLELDAELNEVRARLQSATTSSTLSSVTGRIRKISAQSSASSAHTDIVVKNNQADGGMTLNGVDSSDVAVTSSTTTSTTEVSTKEPMNNDECGNVVCATTTSGTSSTSSVTVSPSTNSLIAVFSTGSLGRRRKASCSSITTISSTGTDCAPISISAKQRAELEERVQFIEYEIQRYKTYARLLETELFRMQQSSAAHAAAMAAAHSYTHPYMGAGYNPGQINLTHYNSPVGPFLNSTVPNPPPPPPLYFMPTNHTGNLRTDRQTNRGQQVMTPLAVLGPQDALNEEPNQSNHNDSVDGSQSNQAAEPGSSSTDSVTTTTTTTTPIDNQQAYTYHPPLPQQHPYLAPSPIVNPYNRYHRSGLISPYFGPQLPPPTPYSPSVTGRIYAQPRRWRHPGFSQTGLLSSYHHHHRLGMGGSAILANGRQHLLTEEDHQSNGSATSVCTSSSTPDLNKQNSNNNNNDGNEDGERENGDGVDIHIDNNNNNNINDGGGGGDPNDDDDDDGNRNSTSSNPIKLTDNKSLNVGNVSINSKQLKPLAQYTSTSTNNNNNNNNDNNNSGNNNNDNGIFYEIV